MLTCYPLIIFVFIQEESFRKSMAEEYPRRVGGILKRID